MDRYSSCSEASEMIDPCKCGHDREHHRIGNGYCTYKRCKCPGFLREECEKKGCTIQVWMHGARYCRHHHEERL